jgi:hypothetical protein
MAPYAPRLLAFASLASLVSAGTAQAQSPTTYNCSGFGSYPEKQLTNQPVSGMTLSVDPSSGAVSGLPGGPYPAENPAAPVVNYQGALSDAGQPIGTVSGTIDQTTGTATISVRRSSDPTTDLFSYNLNCTRSP